MEILIVFGITLVVLIPMLYLSLRNANEGYKITQAGDTVNSLAITANAVHNLGKGSKDRAVFRLPDGLDSISITGNEILIRLNINGEIDDVRAKTRPVVVGNIPLSEGLHEVSVKAITDEVVRIGSGPFILELVPNRVKFTQLPVDVRIIGDEFETGAEVLIDGNVYPNGFVTFVNQGEIIFNVVPGFFPPEPGGAVYKISVRNLDGEVSNEVDFIVDPTGGAK